MNIIFLDIDGVLNTTRYRKIQMKYDHISEEEAQFNFDPISLKYLSSIINETNAYIVISSTWRYNRDDKNDRYWNEIFFNLKRYNLENRIIGATEDLRDIYNTISCRGYEINEWIERHGEVSNYVILDDDPNMNGLEAKLAYCDEDYGLNEEVFNIALKILKNEYIPEHENPLYYNNIF